MAKNRSELCHTCLKLIEVRRMHTHTAMHAKRQAKADLKAKNFAIREEKRLARAQAKADQEAKSFAIAKAKKHAKTQAKANQEAKDCALREQTEKARVEAKLNQEAKSVAAAAEKKLARAQAKANREAKNLAAKQAKKQSVKMEREKKKELISAAKLDVFVNKTLPLSIMLWYICGNYDPKGLYHVIYKDDFKTLEDKLYFQAHWKVVENIHCQCQGSNVMSGKVHTHMLAEYSNREAIATFRKKLSGKMNGRQAAKFIPVLPKRLKYGSSIKINSIVHLMDIILYIQTEEGTHKKYDHLFNSLQDWKWSQVTYMKYLQYKIECERLKLQNIPNRLIQEDINDRIVNLSDRLRQLENQWGSHEKYTNEELEIDLESWLDFCKQTTLEDISTYCIYE